MNYSRQKKQNDELAAENRHLSEKIEQLEQYQRSNNLEIKGVPEEGDACDVVKRIGAFLDEPISDGDIDICHRVPTFRPLEKNLVVRFVQRSKRDKLLAKARKNKITTKDLDYGGSTAPVFINEHLTNSNKKLMGAAVAKKKQEGWKFVWTAGGKIYARQNEDTDAIRITGISDLEKITR